MGGVIFMGDYKRIKRNFIREDQISGGNFIREYKISGGYFFWEYQIGLGNFTMSIR